MHGLIRTFGIAAIIGGLLRVADSFTTQSFSAGTLAALYFTTDLFLLLGMAGIYLCRRTTIGVAGTLGAAIFTLGIVLVRVSAFGVLGTTVISLALRLRCWVLPFFPARRCSADMAVRHWPFFGCCRSRLVSLPLPALHLQS